MMHRRIVHLVLLVLFAVIGLTFIWVNGAVNVSAQGKSDTLTMAFIEGEPTTLDPQASSTVNEALVLRNVYEGLVTYDPKTLQPIPQLAEKWDISADGTTYTFHLHKGVKFHNGREMTAKDVKYSLERLANPKTGTSYTKLMLDYVKGIDAVRKGDVTDVEGLKIVDDTTFSIELTRPIASFLNQLSLLGGLIVPQEAAEKPDFAQNPIGTGPYKFVQWVHQKQITLEANADYWGTTPKIKFIVLQAIGDSLKQVDDFKNGKIDITVIPPFEAQRLHNDSKLDGQFQEVPAFAVTYLMINLQDPALSKPEVRQALNYAIDRDALVRGVLKNLGSPAQNIVPPLLSVHDESVTYSHDREKAKTLLKTANYGDGLTLAVNLATDETEKRLMGVIQAQWAEVGVNLSVNSTDKATYDTLRRACQGQLFVSTWTGDYADPSNFVHLYIDSAAPRQKCGYGTYDGAADIKKMIQNAEITPQGADRDKLYVEIQKTATEKALIIPIYYRSRTALISPRLQGAYLDATLVVKFADISIQDK